MVRVAQNQVLQLDSQRQGLEIFGVCPNFSGDWESPATMNRLETWICGAKPPARSSAVILLLFLPIPCSIAPHAHGIRRCH